MKKLKEQSNTKRQNILGYLFLLPWLIGFIVFVAYPFIYTAYLSFFDVKQTIEGYNMTFVALGNYERAFFKNLEFGPSIVNFLIMELTYTPTIIVIGFILALLLNKKIKFRAGFRALFFFPVIVLSGPVMSHLMETGATSAIGITENPLFKMVYSYSPPIAGALEFLFQNYSMVLWFTGIPIVLFISGLQKINSSVIEAATIDSATSWQILWKITIPIMRSTILIAAIFTVVQLGMFNTNPVLDMITAQIYDSVGGLGTASAYAWVYSIIVLLLILVIFLLLKDRKVSEAREIKKRQKKWGAF